MSGTNKFLNFVDKIFVVNLDERKDRWDNIVLEFGRIGIPQEKYERFSAIRPEFKDLPEKWHNKLVSPHKRNPEYIRSTIGCKMSQNACVQIAKERGYKNIIICEDDVAFVFPKHTTYDILDLVVTQLSQCEYHMCYLSGNHLQKPMDCGLADSHLYKTFGTLAAHAYFLNCSIFDYIIENMMGEGCELDNYYISYIQKQGKSYTIRPGLVTQKPGYSDILKRVVDYRNVIS